MVAIAVAFYAFCTALLSLVALERAVRSGDRFASASLAMYGLAGAAATVASVLGGAALPISVLLFACVAVCAATDLSAGRIYNSVLAVALVMMCVLSIADGTLAAPAGGALGFGTAIALRAASFQRGLGFGDVKLFAIVGLGLGAPAILTCMGMSFVLGAICALALLASARIKRSIAIPFAPFIAIAAMVTPCFR